MGPAPQRPLHPPIYDPAHYGYGPRGDLGLETEPIDLPPMPDDEPGWRRRVLPALVGALAATVAIVGALLVLDDRPETVETVFEFPDSGPSVTLEGEVLDIQALLDKVQPSVVTIDINAESPRGIFEGAGSGIVVGSDGVIVTNAHVIQGADRIDVTFFNGTVKQADLVGTFPDDDIAVIRARDISGLVPAELGSSETLRVGDDVVAIGNALDLGSTPSVTKGIVSAKGRSIDAPPVTLENLIQTDAAINPGNSGGPLVNALGQVVGINTAIIDDAQSVGFAISIDVAGPLVERALGGDAELNPDTAFLGVTTISVEALGDEVADEFSVSATAGAFVQDIVDGSPAADAGVERGDVIVAIDAEPIGSAEDVARTVRALRPGDSVEVVVERGGESRVFSVVLGVRN